MLIDNDGVGLTDEQLLLMRTAARFADDERGRPRSDDRAVQAWRQLAALGFLGIRASEDIGGLGGNAIDEAIVASAMGRGLVPVAYPAMAVMAVHLLGDAAEATAGIISGERPMTVADDEPDSAYGAARTARLTRTDGGFRLTGLKTPVLGTDIAQSILVTARDDASGETAIVRIDAGAAGLHTTPIRLVDGRAAAHLQFDLPVVDSDIIARGADAATRLNEARDRAAIAAAAEAVGAMRGALALTYTHLRTRQQFNKPLAQFQALRHRFASMAIDVECAESAVFAAAAAANDPARRATMASIAKARCASAGLSVGESAVQLHGGLGMTDDYAVGHYYKRLLVLNALNGSREDHLDRLTTNGVSPD